jgi:hypothetical protein
MYITSVFFIGIELIFFILGFLISFWPFTLLGIGLAVWRGNWILALMFALAADLLYGVPVGLLHIVGFPFTVAALIGIVTRAALSSQMRRSV